MTTTDKLARPTNANPRHTLTDFRALGSAKLRRGGRTAAEAKRLHDTRAGVRAQPIPAPSVAGWVRGGCRGTPPANVRTIPLGSHTIRPTAHERARNWRAQRPWYSTRAHALNQGRYSSRCSYTHWEYQQWVESWGAVVGGHLFARVRTDYGIVTVRQAPWRGWTWAIDENGICFRSPDGRDEYHPMAADLLGGYTERDFARTARENGKARRRAEREAKREALAVSRSARSGVWVSVADSRRAGNCLAGTLTWARRHGLDVGHASHVTARRLLELANGDASRVAVVVAQAARRHAREMRQGYCTLAEHVAAD